MPYDLYLAVSAALSVLSWFENLPKDEQPPRHIWWSEDLLEDWFAEVSDNRKAKYGQGGRKRTSYEAADDVPMMENEVAAEYRRKMLDD